MPDERELIESFLRVAQLARLELAEADVRSEVLAAPHRRPSRLPEGCQAVYAFVLGNTCLKVGKAGPKTAARFISQHYGLNAPSTLAKSILAHRARVAPLLPAQRANQAMDLSEQNVGRWIETNTSRTHVFLPTSAGPFALSLLEAFMQCRFKPLFEGRTE